MIRLIRNAALSILAMSFIAQASAANWEEETHYQVLDTPVKLIGTC
jgi:thiol:disulfide interchange protein DsbA